MHEDLTRKMPNSSGGKLDEVFQIIQAIRSELSELRNTVETRLYDTRPIWEKVQADIGQLQAEQQSLQAGQDSLRGEVREIRTHLRGMDRRLSIFNDTLVGIQADYRDIYDRVRDIGRQRN